MNFYLNMFSRKTFLLGLMVLTFAACKRDSNTDEVNTDVVELQGVKTSTPDTSFGFSKKLATENLHISIKTKDFEGGKMINLIISQRDGGNISKKIKIDGEIIDAFTADLNGDGKDEVYIFNQGEGSGSYGNLYGYQAETSGLDSISMGDLPAQYRDKYMGHDSFAIDGKQLLRFIPLYNEIDPTCCPTGGKATIKYKLANVKGKLVLVAEQK